MAPVRHGLENAEHRRVGNAAFAKLLKTPDATEKRGVHKAPFCTSCGGHVLRVVRFLSVFPAASLWCGGVEGLGVPKALKQRCTPKSRTTVEMCVPLQRRRPISPQSICTGITASGAFFGAWVQSRRALGPTQRTQGGAPFIFLSPFINSGRVTSEAPWVSSVPSPARARRDRQSCLFFRGTGRMHKNEEGRLPRASPTFTRATFRKTVGRPTTC